MTRKIIGIRQLLGWGITLSVFGLSCSQVAKDGRTEGEGESASNSPAQKFEGDESSTAPTAVAGAFMWDSSKVAVTKVGDHFEVKGQTGAVERRNVGKSVSFRLSESGKVSANEKIVVSLLIFSAEDASKMLAPAISSKSAATSSFEVRLKAVLQTGLVDGTFRFAVRLTDSDVVVLKIGSPSAATPVMDPPAAVLAMPSRQLSFVGVTAKSTLIGGAISLLISAPAAILSAGEEEVPSAISGLAIGDGFTCYLNAEGRIFCNGLNARFVEGTVLNSQTSVFRLATITTELRVPTEVLCPMCTYVTGTSNQPIREIFMQITAGQNHACALAQSNNVYCWGMNQRGQAGIGYDSGGPISSPTKISTPTKFIAIGAGVDHTCGITVDNKVFCWGDNARGKFASDFGCIGSATQCNAAFTPMEITTSSGFATPGNVGLAQVAASQSTTCIRTSVTPSGDAPVYCWGDNAFGQTGSSEGSISPRIERPDSPVLRNRPGQAPVPAAFRSISAGRLHFCGMTYENKMMCWGDNTSGQVVNLAMSNFQVAIEVTGRNGVTGTSISASGQSTCILETGGSLFCWGAGTPLLGCGDTAMGTGIAACSVVPPLGIAPTNAPVYTAVEGSRFGALDSSARCGHATTGDYYCWGISSTSVLGIGGMSVQTMPYEMAVPHLVAPLTRLP